MWIVRWIAILLVIILALWFGFQNNSEIVTVKFWKYQVVDVPLVMTLFVAFVLGALSWFLVALIQIFQLKNEIRIVRKSKEKLQGELANLRNLSIEDDTTGIEKTNE